jgi:hypothetical protein
MATGFNYSSNTDTVTWTFNVPRRSLYKDSDSVVITCPVPSPLYEEYKDFFEMLTTCAKNATMLEDGSQRTAK